MNGELLKLIDFDGLEIHPYGEGFALVDPSLGIILKMAYTEEECKDWALKARARVSGTSYQSNINA